MEGRRRKKKPLSRLAKTFLSYALIAALALPTQAAWADGQSLADGDAAGDGSLAVGEGSGAYAEGSIAIGRNAVAETDGEYALAVGYSANASGKNSVAIGYNSVASEAYTVSVGGNGTTRRIVNVAEGTADTDAATVGQLASLGSKVAGIVGAKIGYDGGSFSGAINIGGADYKTIELALNALYNGTAGSTGGAVGGDEIVIDPSNGAVTIAGGGNIQITRDAADSNKFTVSVSPTPTFTAVYTGSVSMSSDGINMDDKKITGLAEGEITAGSTDAVTGGQLYTTNENIKTVSDSLGESVSKALGGTSAFADGKVTAGIEVGGTTYDSVQEALNAVNTGGGTAAANAVQYDDDSKTSVTLNKSGDAVKLTNIADGKDDLDAVNKRQLDAVQGQVDVHKTTLEKHETTLNEHTVMIENHEEQFTTLQTVLGDTYSSPSFSSITVGNIYSDGTNINMGGGTITGLADGSIAPGSTDAVTGGQLYGLGESVSKALGGYGSAFADGEVKAEFTVGGQTYDSVQAALNAVSTGGGTAVGNAVQYDDDSKAIVTLKDKDGGAVKLTNLAEGEITAGSTDAVTGGQLYTTNENIKTVSDSLGESVSKALGGTSAFADGKVTAGIEVGGTTYDSVQEALNAVNTGGGTAAANAVQYDDDSKTSVTLNKSGDAVKLTNIADGKDDLDAVNKRQLDAVQGQVDVHKTTLEKHETTLNEHTVMIENHEEQFTTLQTVLGDTYSSPSFSSITVGNIYSDGTNINMGGGTITGLADGSIAPGSTDAVTGGQLWNAYKRMDDLNESINIVGAHAAALSGLHPIQYNPYEPTTLSAAVGTYRDEYAVAVGVFHYVRSNVLFNLGASICSDGDVMGRAGVSLAVGKGGRKKPELARDMVGMQQQMIAMQAMLEELKEENAKNKETIKKNEETIKELKEALGKKK